MNAIKEMGFIKQKFIFTNCKYGNKHSTLRHVVRILCIFAFFNFPQK